MRNEFIEAMRKHQNDFALELLDETIAALADFYELVIKHNELLHLVAPCSAEEFAVRHILESLTALEFLPPNAKFADVGSGAGLPSIPCLIVRDDLRGVLIESKLKKAGFLGEAINELGLAVRAEIVNRQFEEVKKPDVSFVFCRALDKFTNKLPRLLKWSRGSGLLFFGGPSLREALTKNGVEFSEELLPISEKRFLFFAQN